MTARILDGKAIAAEVRADVAEHVSKLAAPPGLAAVLVGDDPASHVYVGQKRKMAAEVGIASIDADLPASVSQAELIDRVRTLNENPMVHGILVQLPLPDHIDPILVQETIHPRKDVDGLHPENQGLLSLGRPRFIPCTPAGCVEILERSEIDLEGKRVVVIGRSNLVGRPLSMLLGLKAPGLNATVTTCHTGTKDIGAYTRDAEIIFVAAGRRNTLTADMVSPGVVVIDVGTNRNEEGKLVGDVDFAGVSEVAGAITPVPGGVGPMTVAMLLMNTVRAAEGLV
ncbi:MAG TPA: bifunctional 5,10-methylenetetrahydrofolate dehydrogenase/5,10-methenyltetrahydrofolate cyclohydrolase [Actinomycetota bacterium]|nr:bifunctional 5,10-methylenetetrahydrofolate dehydrogenase/5,10-methenyltetrahydrofolate cyclohydrolase [Actinomycetota bacterium]